MTSIVFPGFGNSSKNRTMPEGLDPASTALPGLAFSVHKKPIFRSAVFEASNGNEVRVSYSEFPRWEFELTYEFLEDRSGASSSLKTIMGFFTDMKGSFEQWLFKDPDDYLCQAAVMGEADATTTKFYFLRYLGSIGERIGQVDEDNDINLYLDGVLIDPADYTVTSNFVVFDAAPVSGTITADFQFYFVCRFLDDQQDYEKFMDQLWSLQTCAFKSILQ